MKKTFLRFVSTALAVFMLFGCMNFSVFAADLADEQNNAAGSTETLKFSVSIESATLATLVANKLTAAENAVLNHSAVKTDVIDLFTDDIDSYVSVTVGGSYATIKAESVESAVGTWEPVSVVVDGTTIKLIDGEAACFDTEIESIDVNYSLKVEGSGAEALATLPATLAKEAAEQLRVLEFYLGLKDKLEEANGKIVLLTSFGFKTEEAKAMAKRLKSEGIKSNKLYFYTLMNNYEKQGLAYFYKNSEKFIAQIELLRDVFEAFSKDEAFIKEAGNQGALSMLESVQNNLNNPEYQLIPANSAINAKGDVAGLIEALEAVTEYTEISALEVSGSAAIEFTQPEDPEETTESETTVETEETTESETTESETTESETTESETTESETTESETTESETTESETTESETTESEPIESETTESETTESETTTEPVEPEVPEVPETKIVPVTIGGVTFKVSYSAGGSYNLLLPAPEDDDAFWAYDLGGVTVNVPAGEDLSINKDGYTSLEDLLNDAADLVGADVNEAIENTFGDLGDSSIDDVLGGLDNVADLEYVFSQIFSEVSREELSIEELRRNDLLNFVNIMNQAMLKNGNAFVDVNGKKIPAMSFIVAENAEGKLAVVLRVTPFLKDVDYQELVMQIVMEGFFGMHDYKSVSFDNSDSFVSSVLYGDYQLYMQGIIDLLLTGDFSLETIAKMINSNGTIDSMKGLTALEGFEALLGDKIGGELLGTALRVEGFMPDSEIEATYSAEFPFYVTFEDYGTMTSVLKNVDKVLTALGQYITIEGKDGTLAISFRMPAKLTAYYLAELLVLDYADISDIENISFEDSVEFILSVIKPFLSDDVTLEVLENTLAMAGVDYDLSSFMSESDFANLRKILRKLINNMEFVVDEENNMKVNMTENVDIKPLVDKLASMNSSIASMIGLIAEADGDLENGEGITIRVSLEDRTLKENEVVAIVVDPSVVGLNEGTLSASGVQSIVGNANKNYINVLSTTGDLAKTLANASENTIVVLLKDVELDSEVVIKNRVFINLNGFTITGNMSTNAGARITNSNFANVGGVDGELSGNFIITGGAYTCDVSKMTAKGYKVNNGVVENELINFSADENGNITVAFTADFINGNKIPAVKDFLVDSAFDIALNVFTMASLSIDGNDIYSIEFNNLVGMLGSSKAEIAEELYACFDFAGITNVANALLEEFTDFNALAAAIENNEAFASYEITTENWHITTGVAGEKDKYLTVGITTKNEETKTISFIVEGTEEEKAALVALLESIGGITNIDATVDFTNIRDMAANVVATVDFSKDGRYGVIIAAAVAYAQPARRAELVEAINTAIATDESAALEAALNKVSVGDFIDALKALGNNSFASMMSTLKLESSYVVALEAAYADVFNLAGKVLSRLGISGGYGKTLGGIFKNGEYKFDTEKSVADIVEISVDLTMVLFDENTKFNLSIEPTETILGFHVIEGDGKDGMAVINAVATGVTVAELKAAFNIPVEVHAQDGREKADNELVVTGDYVSANGQKLYDIAMTGDTSGDGIVDANDAMAWADAFVGLIQNSAIFDAAADLNNDGVIDTLDLAKLIYKYASNVQQ